MRFTINDLEAIGTALSMISADDWDEASYGERPDFERAQQKVQARLAVRRERCIAQGTKP